MRATGSQFSRIGEKGIGIPVLEDNGMSSSLHVREKWIKKVYFSVNLPQLKQRVKSVEIQGGNGKYYNELKQRELMTACTGDTCYTSSN